MSKPKIVTLPVSWQISPSLSLLKLTISEDEEITLAFGANILNPEKAQKEIVRRQIIVSFERVLWIKSQLALSDRNAFDPSLYDWQLVKSEYRQGRNFSPPEASEFNEMWNKEWFETGNCPLPYAYEIYSDPQYLTVIDMYPALTSLIFHHYLFVGREMFVEVVCESLKWNAK